MTFSCKITKPLANRSKGFLCLCKPYPDNPYVVVQRLADKEDETKDAWEKIEMTETVEDDENP